MWCKISERPIVHQKKLKYKHKSLLAAISFDKVISWMIVDGPVETITWTYFIKMMFTNDVFDQVNIDGQKATIVRCCKLIKISVLII